VQIFAVAPHCITQDSGGEVGSRSVGVELGRFRGGFMDVGLGRFRGGFRNKGVELRVGLGLCKVGGVGSGSDSSTWILCSAVRTISMFVCKMSYSFMQKMEHTY